MKRSGIFLAILGVLFVISFVSIAIADVPPVHETAVRGNDNVPVLEFDPSLVGIGHERNASQTERAQKNRAKIRYGTLQRDSAESRPTPNISPAVSSGELRIKMKPGFHLTKRAGKLNLMDDEGDEIDRERTRKIDRDLPDLMLEPLYGERNLTAMAKLKRRGERRCNCELPDLSLWYKASPLPENRRRPAAKIEKDFSNEYTFDELDALEHTHRLIGELPGVEMVYYASPLLQSSVPSYTHPSDWSQHQYHTGPDVYDDNMSYNYTIIPEDYENFDDKNFPIECSNGKCFTGGLNVWPAWDAGFFGESVPIGYIEVAWCLGTQQAGDLCGTHPDLAYFESNYLSYLTSNNFKNTEWAGHGTPVLGIMAADHYSGTNVGVKGISPQSNYYLGQALYPDEWLDIAEMLIDDPNGEGAIYLIEPNMWCDDPNGWEVLDRKYAAPCPAEIWPEIHDFITIVTSNDIVVVSITGNGVNFQRKENYNEDETKSAGINFDNPQTPYRSSDFTEYPWVWTFSSIEDPWNDPAVDFEMGDRDFDWGEGVTYPATQKTLNRSSSSFIDPGTIVVGAGIAHDVENAYYDPQYPIDYWSRRSRTQWSSYGSRVDVQGRDGVNASTFMPNEYRYFMGTSSCGPQITGVAALTQEAYKEIRSDHLTSIRMRNALVENGNPQVVLSEDPNRTLNNFGSTKVPEEMEVPDEPFARIGPRPDMGRILTAFGDGTLGTVQYRLSFNDHQYDAGLGFTFIFPSIVNYSWFRYQANEPYATNYAYGNSINWSNGIKHIRSPRISGGHAVLFNAPDGSQTMGDGRYLQVQDDPDNSEDYFNLISGDDMTNFTLSAWVNLLEIRDTNQYIMQKGHWTEFPVLPLIEWAMGVNSSGNPFFYCTRSVIPSSGVSKTLSAVQLETNRLYHLAVVVSKWAPPYYGHTIYFYIDGQLAGSSATTSQVCWKGSDLPSIGYNLDGVLDEVLFEDRVVPQSELQARYEAGANPPGLIADWRMEKRDATTIEDPISRANGTLMGDSGETFYQDWGPGKTIGKFNGTTHYIEIKDPSSNYPPENLRELGSEFSIEAHFKTPESISANQCLISRAATPMYRPFTVDLNSDMKLKMEVWYGAGYSYAYTTQELEPDRWYHAVMTYDVSVTPKVMEIYIDGEAVPVTSSVSGSSGPVDFAVPIKIGTMLNGYFWNGSIDFVRIYKKRLLNDEEGVYGGGWVSTNRDDIGFLFENRAAIWKNSYYGDYPANRYN